MQRHGQISRGISLRDVPLRTIKAYSLMRASFDGFAGERAGQVQHYRRSRHQVPPGTPDNGRIRPSASARRVARSTTAIHRAYESGDGQMVAINDDIASLPEERSREIEVLEPVRRRRGPDDDLTAATFWFPIRSRRNRMCCWLRHSPRPTGWRSCISRCATRPGWRRCASRISASER